MDSGCFSLVLGLLTLQKGLPGVPANTFPHHRSRVKRLADATPNQASSRIIGRLQSTTVTSRICFALLLHWSTLEEDGHRILEQESPRCRCQFLPLPPQTGGSPGEIPHRLNFVLSYLPSKIDHQSLARFLHSRPMHDLRSRLEPWIPFCLIRSEPSIMIITVGVLWSSWTPWTTAVDPVHRTIDLFHDFFLKKII
jgi:hypothetical protein